MPAAINLTGQRFGRLTAIALDTSTSKRLWLFKCDCGTTKLLNGATVRYGNALSCGCLRRETAAARNAIDMAGRRVGRLVVQSQISERNKHGHVRWSCLCDCGTIKALTTHALNKPNPTSSCGCIRREMMRALGASSKKENPISRTPEYRAAMRKKHRAVPERAMAERVSRLMAWALASVGAIKRSATFDLLGYTPAELKAHIEKQFVKGMSWDNRSEWEIDHIIPISSAKTESDVIALNQLSNLRPLWSADNNRKKARRTSLL